MQIDNNLLFDDEISGAAITTGKDLKVTLQAGRFDLDGDTNNDSINAAAKAKDDTANMQSIGLQYGKDKLSIGAGYHHLNSDAFTAMGKSYKSTQDEDNADIWSANLHYAFDKNVALGGVYAENTKADDYKKAGTVELDYKARSLPTRALGALMLHTATSARTQAAAQASISTTRARTSTAGSMRSRR